MKIPLTAIILLANGTYAQASEQRVDVVSEFRGVWFMEAVDANRHQHIGTMSLTLPSGEVDVYQIKCAGVWHKNVYDTQGNAIEPHATGGCVVSEGAQSVGVTTYNAATTSFTVKGLSCTAPTSEVRSNADWGAPAEGEPGVAGDSYDIESIGGLYHYIYKYPAACSEQ